MRARFCFGMFSEVAFASATRAVLRGPRMGPVDLDLKGPNRDCPLAFDDDPGAPCAHLGDLCVSDVSAPESLLPPPIGSTSAKPGRFRREVHGALQS